MNKEHLETGSMENVQETNNYQHYLELGGIINKEDYDKALKRAKDTATFKEATKDTRPLSFGQGLKGYILQAKNIADSAGIELSETKDALDPRTVLYAILHDEINLEQAKHRQSRMSGDAQPKKVEHTRDGMGDHRLFREALRMLGDTDGLSKLKGKYHTNIPFEQYCPLCQKIKKNEDCP